ncbi:site-specific DNA-methyltransferase, partial [bacterium]|nr:site-specific DNA-methyltransferase [bacterium]
MPTLQFKGKNIIWNHHLSIPYHTLDEVKELHYKPEKANGNIIIEGDNLLALKALLPQYAGRIKCIYIDPPYNTGNEHWIYNDNVNSPLLKEWLGKEVGKDDLTRHDKWLCMMVPRLKLLRELLVDDGIIFISIDENEQHNLRQIMNEIYGSENHIVSLIWAGRSGKGGTTKLVEYNHEYIEVFAKNIISADIKPVTNIVENGNYQDEIGNYKREQLRQWGQGDKKEDRPNMFFPIIAPDGTVVFPKRA